MEIIVSLLAAVLLMPLAIAIADISIEKKRQHDDDHNQE